MAIKRSVFSSKGEERGFRSIERTWGERHRVFPQFPFSALFEPDDSIRDKSNLFFKTSIDYVFCTSEGVPVLAIDFDGLGKGFNKDGQYIQTEKTNDPHRKSKFDFKIRYSEKDDFPYYIVASDEFKHLGQDLSLTIVDGIIGSVLAKKDFDQHIPFLIEEHRDIIENLMPDEQQDYVQDLVISQEVDSDFAYNPIIQKTAEVRYNISAITGSMAYGREEYHYFEEPELPGLEGPGSFGSIESLSARLAAMKDVEVLGCACTLFDTPIGEVSEVATMRNIGYSDQYLSLIKEIAELLVWTKYSRLLSKKLP